LCRTLEDEIRGSYDLARRLGHPVPTHVQQFVEALGGSRPLPLQAESVKHLKSLQVAFAERFVFASRKDYDLAREMLQATPKLKTGPRMG
jgi:hypothetical protein